MATAVENTGPAQYVDPVTGYPKPPIGAGIGPMGAVLVAFTGGYAASTGSYAYGTALFVRIDDYQPYVVWRLILRPSGEWIVEQGDYCRTLAEAVEAYKSRGGKVG